MKKYILLLAIFLSLNVFAQKTNVLFFGNSITASGIPEMLVQLGEASGDSIFAELHWGGQLLYDYVKDAGMTESTRMKIAEKPWDYVVLQENSQVSGFYPGWDQGYFEYYSYDAAKEINNLIKDKGSCTETMFFMTYGYINGDSMNFPGDTYEKQQTRIRRNYKLLADSNSAEISPVGMAWKKIRNEQPWGDELYMPGDHHPSEMGTYLAACVFYCSILKKSPVGISFYGAVEPMKAIELQKAAAAVVFDSTDTWNHDINVPEAAFFEQHFDKTVLAYAFSESKYVTHLYNFGDGNTSFNPSPEHEYDDYGTYTIKHKVTSQCYPADSSSKTITLEPNGIEEKSENEISVYPQPVVDYLFINGVLSPFNYQIYSLEGKEIGSGLCSDNQIKMIDFKNGIYILKIQNNTSIKTIKIVK
jgi:hypothetical protein